MPARHGSAPASAAVATSPGEAVTDRSEWQGRVGASWAQQWQRTDRSFGPVTERLLAAAEALPFAAALDIGCGAGEVSLRLALAHPSSCVIGIDLSQPLVEIAGERTCDLSNVRIELADASKWIASHNGKPDMLISRHGVMFFDDPVGAFRHLRRQTTARGRLAFSCFRTRRENEWVRMLESILPRPPAIGHPFAPGPFAFGDRERVVSILSQSGWRDIGFEPVDCPMLAGTGDHAVDEAREYFLRIGPAARAIAELAEPERAGTVERLAGMLALHRDGDVVSLPTAQWIVTARAG